MRDHFAFDQEEVYEVLISIAVLSFGFAYTLFNPGTVMGWVKAFPLAALLVAVGVIPHEYSHRSSAKFVNAYASYRLWKTGLVLAVLTPFLGFVFAAPGGVRIKSNPSERFGRWWIDLTPQQIALTTLSGPLVNIGFAVAFMLLTPVSPNVTVNGAAVNVFTAAAHVNAAIAFFSLFPVNALDGGKLLRWNTWFWLFMFLMALTFLIFIAVAGGV